MHIAQIWRYPVKSMLGEPLEEASVGPGGIQGDRRWAVVDKQSGVSLSAKRYPDLLRCRARMSDEEVVINLPDDREFPAGSAELSSRLSDLLGRDVTTRSADATRTIKHEFPTAVTEGKGEPFLYEPETEAFFDCAALHLLTTATLSELQRLLPDSSIHQSRFRPNFLVTSAETGFVEHNWVNSDVMLGAQRCHVYDDTRRCIMVALGQGEMPRDMAVIRTIQKQNEGRAGIALKTTESGVVRAGDRVEVLYS